MVRVFRNIVLGVLVFLGVVVVSTYIDVARVNIDATVEALPFATSAVDAVPRMPDSAAPQSGFAYPAPDSAYPGPASETPVYRYRIINTYPHDPEAFTQGLAFVDGKLYEGTGLYGQSTLRRVDLKSGALLQLAELEEQYFGEGITIWEDRIIQLTWQSNIGFVYDRETFERIGEFSYPTEGWGLTHDGSRLIMSDGSANLYFLDPETFERIGQIRVTDAGMPVDQLNELEYIDGEVYANIWRSDRIARIDPESGAVVAWIDLTGLLAPEDYAQNVDVLNGIAYDVETGRLFVTGKLWPRLFEIELVPAEALVSLALPSVSVAACYPHCS